MATYIIPVNANISNIDKISEIFSKYGFILWIHRRNYPKYQKNDIIYMYITSPHKRIRFKARIEEINVQATEDDLKDYTWIDKTKLDEQIKNNRNNKLMLKEEVNTLELKLDKLRKFIIKKNLFPYGNPINITDNEDLINYIESSIDKEKKSSTKIDL